MRKLWVAPALALVWLIVPEAALAHEGNGFHPEDVVGFATNWRLLVAVGVCALLGVLWLYERVGSRQSK